MSLPKFKAPRCRPNRFIRNTDRRVKITIIKSRKTRWAGKVARIREQKCIWKYGGKSEDSRTVQ